VRSLYGRQQHRSTLPTLSRRENLAKISAQKLNFCNCRGNLAPSREWDITIFLPCVRPALMGDADYFNRQRKIDQWDQVKLESQVALCLGMVCSLFFGARKLSIEVMHL